MTSEGRGKVEVLAGAVLITVLGVLIAGAVAIAWTWPAEQILQFLRFN